MTLEGPDGMRYLVRRDGSLVMDGDGYDRPVRIDDLDPASARIVRGLIDAAQVVRRQDAGDDA